MQNIESNKNQLRNKLIIFVSIAVLAIHNLVFLNNFKVNLPFAADWNDVFNPVFFFITEGNFTFFENKVSHVIAFPKLLSYPNFLFNSFDVGNLYYFQWIIMSLTILVFYLIIKQTDKKLFWTLIPISAFVYNPLTTGAYWSLAILGWIFQMLGITATIYFLNKKSINLKTFGGGIFTAIFSTFSILIGVVSWFSGLLMLLQDSSKKKFSNKKWIILWIISTAIVGLIYLKLIEGHSPPLFTEQLFSFSTYSFIANFLASSFRVKFQVLLVSIGSVSLILSGLYVYYFSKQNYLKQYFPWFVLLFTALIAAIIAAIGRVGMEGHFGNDTYYSTVSQLFQIGLIVLSAKIIYEFRKPPKSIKKNFVVYFLIILLVTQMIMLVPSYYSGYIRAEKVFEEKQLLLNCFSLSANIDCDYLPISAPMFNSAYASTLNYLIQNNLGIFNEKQFNEKNTLSLEKFETYIDNNKFFEGGQITLIDGNDVISKNDFHIKKEFVRIDGWLLLEKAKELNSIFLIIDGKQFLESHNFKINDIENEQNLTKFDWSAIFLSGYLDSGCHSLEIVGISDNEKILLKDKMNICKNEI